MVSVDIPVHKTLLIHLSASSGRCSNSKSTILCLRQPGIPLLQIGYSRHSR
jgi:hypothetical protein